MDISDPRRDEIREYDGSKSDRRDDTECDLILEKNLGPWTPSTNFPDPMHISSSPSIFSKELVKSTSNCN